MSETTAGIMAEIDRGNRPRSVSANHGWSWIVDGYHLVRPNLGTWVLVTIVWFAINILIGLIPVVSVLASLLWPVFVGGLMLGCREQDDGRDMTVGYLFAGFQHHAGKLFALAGLYLAGILAIALVAVIFLFGSAMLGYSAGPQLSGELGATVSALFALFAFAIVIPLIMLVWFAPALVVLQDMGVFEAMKLSFVGCWRNILPFLLYGVLGLVLTIVAIIPMGLGLLILFPVFWGGMYVGYKEIFVRPAAA